jgi:hypothetical protein
MAILLHQGGDISLVFCTYKLFYKPVRKFGYIPAINNSDIGVVNAPT